MSRMPIRADLVEQTAARLAKSTLETAGATAADITENAAHETIEGLIGKATKGMYGANWGRYYRTLSQNALAKLVKDVTKRARAIYSVRAQAMERAAIVAILGGQPALPAPDDSRIRVDRSDTAHGVIVEIRAAEHGYVPVATIYQYRDPVSGDLSAPVISWASWQPGTVEQAELFAAALARAIAEAKKLA